VQRPADVTVEVAVRARPREEWAEPWWSGPRIDVQNGVLDLRRAEWTAVFDLKRRHVEAVLDWAAPSFFDLLLRQVLEVFTVHDRSGLVLHASAVETEERAVLFLGRSEAGKSTAAALAASRGSLLLADDVIFVEVREGVEPRVHCLPIVQKNEGMLRPHSATLAAMYSVSQSTVDAVDRLESHERLRQTMKATALFIRHPLYARPCFQLAEKLVCEVPLRALRFRDTPAFWDVVHEDLSSLSP